MMDGPAARPPAALPRGAGFTLVELLVVIAIIGVLATLAYSATGTMIEKAKTIQCQSNLRQIGLAIHLYASDHHDRLPSNSHQRGPDGSPLSWTHTLEAYLGPEFLGRCPSTPDHPARITYALNDLLAEPDGTGIPFLSVRDPSTTLTIAEIATHQFSEHFHFRGAARGRVSASFFRSLVNVTAHGDGANYLFVDGHVDTLPWPEIQQRLDQPNPVLLQP